MLYLILGTILAFQISLYLVVIRLGKTLNFLLKKENQQIEIEKEGFKFMALDFAALADKVSGIETVEASTEVTLTELVNEVKDLASQVENPADQEAINAFATRLEVSRSALATAIANVPPAPTKP